jgi:glycosyltransferase involved in cell wall biosynthesis
MMHDETGGLRMAVITPVYDDWLCVNELLRQLSTVSTELPPMTVFVVDDGSTTPVVLDVDDWGAHFEASFLVTAGTNLGHQRAIALGITEVLKAGRFGLVLVIDADGEDDPRDAVRLLRALGPGELSISVAQRQGRSEALGFRAFYRMYRWAFRALTGRRLDFGNFCLLSIGAADRLGHMPELWNHFPAAIMRSKLPITKVPTDRSSRYFGESRMNFVALVNHGLAAISTFTDVVFARLLIVVSALAGLCVLVAGAVIGVRIGSDAAIPGWATTVVGFALLGLFQFLTVLSIMTFTVLSSRSNIPSTPIAEAPKYLKSFELVHGTIGGPEE